MIRGLGDIKKEETKKKEERKTSDFYAGGERSGLAVQSPDDVEQVLNKARQETHQPSRESTGSEFKVNITLFSNGFTVNDGSFRDYNAPENARFMSELNQGRVPAEIFKESKGKPVDVNLTDRRQEEYVPPPPPKYVAFSGDGLSLGGSTSSATEPINLENGLPVVDPNLPTANVQVRFHNGQRKNLTLNLNTTVATIFEYVVMAAPVDGSFELLTGFPPAPLTDPSQTIESAGLAGAAVIQKLL